MNPGELTLATPISTRDFESGFAKATREAARMPHISKVLKLFEHANAWSDLHGFSRRILALFGYEKTSFIKVIYLEY